MARALNHSPFDEFVSDDEVFVPVGLHQTATRKTVNAETLLRWFDDPHIAIAAGVVVVAFQDVQRSKGTQDAQDAKHFLRSPWFRLIADALQLHSEYWQSQINSI